MDKEKKTKFKKIIKIFGYIIVILSFVFIINSFRKLDIGLIKQNIDIYWVPWLLFLIFLYSFVVFIYSIAWKYIVEMLSGAKLNIYLIASIYLKANIAKYLPGNVFHFAGRHYLVRKEGVSNKALLLSNGMEIFFLIMISLLIIVVGFFTKLIKIPEIVKEKINIYYFLIIGIVFLSMIIIYVIIKKNKKQTINWMFLFEKKNILTYLKISFIYFIIFIIIGCILNCIFFILLNFSINLNDILFVICVFSLAWVLGYIVPGAPGGLGIRETIIIIMLGYRFTESGALLGSVLLRFITITGDVLAFFIGNIIGIKKGN